MPADLWSSDRIDLNEYKCVDVHADETGVVLGQVDGVSQGRIKFTSTAHARAIAAAINEGADYCDSVRAGAH